MSETVVETPVAAVPAQATAEAEAPRLVPEHAFEPTPLDANFPGGWITPEWAWQGATGKGVRVAILDSGVDASHPAVGAVNGYVIPLEGEGGVWSYDTAPHEDTSGHGTACAGIIRALAPDCEIYSVKVLGISIWGKATTFLQGVRWALDNGMQVCNLSLGTGKREYLPALHELVDEAAFRHVPLVCAARNMPGAYYPSLFASVLSVSSHDVPRPRSVLLQPASADGVFGLWHRRSGRVGQRRHHYHDRQFVRHAAHDRPHRASAIQASQFDDFSSENRAERAGAQRRR